jgi:hypothetical protein
VGLCGTVTAITGSTLSVDIDGTVVTGIPYLASYSPVTVGDSVAVLETECGPVVLGSIYSAPVPVISAVGSSSGSHGNRSPFAIAVSPTAIGDVLVVWLYQDNGGIVAPASVSGGGCSSWTKAVDYINSINWEIAIWFGVIDTVGSATIDVAFDGSLCGGDAQQFNSSLAGTWSVDTYGNNYYASGVSGNFESLTPAGGGELYLGQVFSSNGGSSDMTGSTPDAVYIPGTWQPGLALWSYVLNAASPSAYSPNWAQGGTTTDGPWATTAALLQCTLDSSDLETPDPNP